MTSPMISVVMPVYNAEKYVAEAIESILNQTYGNFEFIIIDDCSTDSSYEILQSYAAKYPRIKLFKNEVNSKLPKTLNFGISQAIGKYIARMDADDISLPARFAKQIEFMESHPEVGVCGTSAIEFNSTSSDLRVMKVQTIHELIKPYSFFVCCNMIHPSIIARRELFVKIGHFSFNENLGGLAEDYALWTEMLHDGVIFANLEQALLKYRVTSSQTTNVLRSQIETFAVELLENNLKKLFGGRYRLKLLKKHIFYIQHASFFKLLLHYLGFYSYKKQFTNANHITKVLSSAEINMFMSRVDPLPKLVYKIKHVVKLILQKLKAR